jgi:hypothetical protein
MNLLLAAALLVLDETPQETFNRIEAVIEDAKSVRVMFTLMPGGSPEELSRGTFSMEEDTKLKLSADLRLKDGNRLAFWSQYENQRIKAAIGPQQVEAQVDGKTARANFNVYLSRLGLFTGGIVDYGMWSRGGGKVTLDLKQLFGVSKVAAVGNGAGGTKILSYEFNSAIKPMPFKWAKIWYDPRSYKLTRREVRWAHERDEQTITEEYEITLDGEKPAGVATPPPGPPKSDAEQDVLFIQAKIQIATEHLKNGNKQKAIDVLEDLALSFPKHALYPDIKRLLEEAKKK